MKLENLNVGAIIMHADAKTNPIHTGTGYFIMGISLDCNDRTGEIAGWNVTLESAFCNRFEGDTFNLDYNRPQIEVVDCPPEEK